MQRFLLPLFFFLLYSFPVSTVLPHQICTASPSVTFRGANDVTRGGDAAVLVFGQLQCANCYGFLRRLNEMAGQRSHRVFVVAPDFESNHIIQRTVSAFPNLQIDRAGEGWPRLGASNFDAMVLDSCGRITDTLSWPKTDVTASHSLQMAMDASRTKCGPCSVPRVTNKKINAYINEQQEQRVRDGGRAAYQPNQRAYQQSGPPQQQQNYPYQNQYQPPYQHQNQHTYPQNYGANGASNNFYTPPPPPQPPAKTTTTAPRIVTTTTDTSDYDYYQNEEASVQEEVKTTQSTQTQIPRPPFDNPPPPLQNWPTYTPYQYQYQNAPYLPPGSYGQPNPHLPKPAMENNLPCSAFTDDICYQQRQSLGPSQMSKCCNKGVYLTDVCVPGKCSNSTIQLCCFQKFLQAKHDCCNDPSQDEGGTKMTNQFNKCCHNSFVTDDPCCPDQAAKRYWSSAYEVCLPTVTVDFSPVRFEVHFTEGVRVLDLSTDRQWEFNCTYGKKRPQYAYLP